MENTIIPACKQKQLASQAEMQAVLSVAALY
jgi:hypothetical protein